MACAPRRHGSLATPSIIWLGAAPAVPGVGETHDHNGATSPNDTSEFDYVIVGAGSAGCVLANRLSADGKHSVLLLEAGPKDTNLWIHVPIGYGKLFKEKTVNWMTRPSPSRG